MQARAGILMTKEQTSRKFIILLEGGVDFLTIEEIKGINFLRVGVSFDLFYKIKAVYTLYLNT